MVNFAYTARLVFLPDSADGWSESTINWNTAPLNNTTTNGFLAGIVLISSLAIDAASVPSPRNIIGLDASISQINANKGANGLVSYAMNTTTLAASIVFASKEHPTLPPPTLQVTYASPLPKRPAFLTAVVATGSGIDLAWVDNTSTETGVQIDRRTVGGSFALLQATASDATSFTDGTAALGTTYEYRIRATSAAGDSAWSLIVSVTAGGGTGHSTGLMTYQSWLQDQRLATTPSDTGDLDRDGLPNLLEYALGLSANTADAVGKPTVALTRIGEENFLTLTFARRLDATGITLTVEVSDSAAGPWTDLDPLVPQHQAEAWPDNPELGWQTLVIKDIVPAGGKAGRFIRLKVTRQ